MCILNVINLYCRCPFRDRARCPHHLYIRSTTQTPILPNQAEPTGFYLRRVGDFQRSIRWEPMPGNRVWDHCATFIRNRLTDPTLCPETVAAGNRYVRTTQWRDLCERCTSGHRAAAPGLRRSNAVRRPRNPEQPQRGGISPDHPFYHFVVWVLEEHPGSRPRGPNEPAINGTSSHTLYHLYVLWVEQGNAPGPRPSQPDAAGERPSAPDLSDPDIAEMVASIFDDLSDWSDSSDSDLDGLSD
ncbi:hypothetical protein QBC40DRAFT_300675 [Triangularia verruculosa]|uniref:Uncharacterized protein n=1 Tax=Triangularia verruculosa TaxID=2587418 RepID=A0AAN6X8T7_9PEZI|nr:hypothetical protein QBC40DRAFT_300675 [Triangularia verruculosa]